MPKRAREMPSTHRWLSLPRWRWHIQLVVPADPAPRAARGQQAVSGICRVPVCVATFHPSAAKQEAVPRDSSNQPRSLNSKASITGEITNHPQAAT